MQHQHHVVPSPAGGWDVKENNSNDRRHFPTKEEAVDYARGVSRDSKTELVIHNEQGQIIESDSHGNDPYPPKG